MSGVNKVILIGRLGKDPDVRTFENNVKKASFTMATSEYYRDKNVNRVEATDQSLSKHHRHRDTNLC